MKRRTRTIIQWRVESRASWLCASDLIWTEFCTIDEPGKPKKQMQGASAAIVLMALRESGSSTATKMEYRIKPVSEPKLK